MGRRESMMLDGQSRTIGCRRDRHRRRRRGPLVVHGVPLVVTLTDYTDNLPMQLACEY